MPMTEAAIRRLTTAQSYEKGEDYYEMQAVTDVQKRGNTLTADVTGSDYEPYHVTVELSANDDILTTSCTCPYDWGGACKHIVAVLLTYLRQPKQIEERPPLQDLLAHVPEATLREILMDLLNAEPHLIDRVETTLATVKTAPAKKTSPQKPKPEPINAAAFRRQAQQILGGSGRRDYYDSGWDIPGSMSALFEKVQPFLDVGDGRNALIALEAIMEPFIGVWYEYDHEGEVGEVFVNAGPLFTEAMLSTDLSQDERKQWKKTLKQWQADLSDYGVEDVFDATIAAIDQGWEYPPLQAVLQGTITDKGAWDGESPFYADDLAIARLNVLERQGRATEYLYLAEAEGQTALYLTMLVKLERSREAVEYALKYAGMPQEAFALAQALYARNHVEDALKIAEHGLTLQGETWALAKWLREVAGTLGKPDIGLKAAREAFNRSCSFEDYQAVKALAGDQWDTIKADLLARLATAQYAHSRVDIYLSEGMLDEAIRLVDQDKYAGYDMVGKVVDAVWQTHPDWAIPHCKQ